MLFHGSKFFRVFVRQLKRNSIIAFLMVFGGILCLVLTVSACTHTQSKSVATPAENPPPSEIKVLRIGHQPHGAPPLLKKRGTLEKRLATKGVAVEWIQFPAGPPIMAALGDGKIDLGMAGEVPPLFAQANGVPLVYVANERAVPEVIAILVSADSPIQDLASLKGKKIAVTKASAGHYLLIQALNKAGLKLKDVDPVYLSPPDGQAAFKRQEVEAWVGWDPFFAVLQEEIPVRILTTGAGLTKNMNFYFSTRSFARNHYDLLKTVIEEMRAVGMWVPTHQQEAAEILAASTGLKVTTAQKVIERAGYEAQPIQDQAIEEQQRIADTFFRLGLLPKQIRVEDAVWKGE